jgi:hypothetical protein
MISRPVRPPGDTAAGFEGDAWQVLAAFCFEAIASDSQKLPLWPKSNIQSEFVSE